MATNKTKFGYLSYQKMLTTIEKGGLDAYDINFTPDTKECYIIDPNLNPWAIRSKVLTFDNEESALEYLVNDKGAYAGQIVAIKVNEKYKAYIVNEELDSYTITPLSSESVTDIDYNNLGNRPIVNLNGSLVSPIIADELDDGLYSFTGQYKVSQKLETIFSGNKSQIFSVEKDSDVTYIRKFSGKEIILYTVGDSVKESKIITSDYLEENNYATKQDITDAISAIDALSQKDAKEYITQLLHTDPDVQDKIDDIVAQKVEEQMPEITDEDIESLFV